MKYLWVLSVLIPLAIVAGVTYVVVNPLSVFNTGPDSLATSLQREVGSTIKGYADAECKGRGSTWDCEFPKEKGSGGDAILFDLRVDDEGCWRAVQVNQRGKTGDGKKNMYGNCLDVIDFAGLTSF